MLCILSKTCLLLHYCDVKSRTSVTTDSTTKASVNSALWGSICAVDAFEYTAVLVQLVTHVRFNNVVVRLNMDNLSQGSCV